MSRQIITALKAAVLVILISGARLHSNTNTNVSTVKTNADEMIEIDIIVSASKVAQPIEESYMKGKVIDEREVKESAAANASSLIQSAGVTYIEQAGGRGSGSDISIQGVDAAHVLVLVDGRKVRTGRGSLPMIENLPSSSIEKVEIVEGPSSFLWGSDAMGGVINILTRKNSDSLYEGLSGSAGLKYANNFKFQTNNHFFSSYLSLNFKGKLFSASLGGTFEYADIWMDEYEKVVIWPNTYYKRKERPRYKSFSLDGLINFDLSSNSSLELAANYFYETIPKLNNRSNRQFNANILLKKELNEKLNIKLNALSYYDFMGRDKSTLVRKDEYFFDNSLDIFLTYRMNERVFLKGGYTLDSSYLHQYFDDASFLLLNNSAYAGGDFKGFGRFSFSFGLRYQNIALSRRDSSVGMEFLNSLSPWAALKLDISKGLKLKFNIGHSFKSPSLKQLFRSPLIMGEQFIMGNPDLEPEKSIGENLSLSFSPGKRFSANISLFRNDFWDLIDYQFDGGSYSAEGFTYPSKPPLNVDRAYTMGASAELMLKLNAAGPLRLGMGAELVRTRLLFGEDEMYVDPDSGEKYLPRIEHRPIFKLNLNSRWRIKRAGLVFNLYGHLYGPAYDYIAVNKGETNYYNEVEMQPRSSFDFRAAKEINSPFMLTTLYFTVKNVFNYKYDEDKDGDRDLPGISFESGINAEF